MNLILGFWAISMMMVPASTVTDWKQSQDAVAGRRASIAVELNHRYAHPQNANAEFRSLPVEQKNKEQTPKSLDQWPMECEGAASRLDFAVIDTQKSEGAYLILVARLGSGEFSRTLNQTRLAGAAEYVLRRGSDLKYVLAQGSRVKGLGRIEVYVGGRLVEIMPLRKNAKGYCIPGQN